MPATVPATAGANAGGKHHPPPPAVPAFDGPSPSVAAVRAAVRAALDPLAEEFNVSYSFGWADGREDNLMLNHVYSPAGSQQRLDNDCGANRLDGGQGACPRTLFHAGSVTKSFTAVAVLRAVVAGKVALDTPMQPLADAAIRPQCNFSLLQLFGHNGPRAKPWIQSITVRHLLQMSSGIRDYNDDWYQQWVLLRGGAASKGGGGEEMHPCDFLRVQDTRLECEAPCAVGDYSSTNFLLLGFVMQALEEKELWTQWDQIAAAIPHERRHKYREVAAPTTGICSEHPEIAHEYSWLSQVEGTRPAAVFDYLHYSCANGWAFGNLAASGHDFAHFFRDIFAPVPANATANATAARGMGRHPLGLSKRIVDEMTVGHSTRMDGQPWEPYGLGVYEMGWPEGYLAPNLTALEIKRTRYVGHGGDGWGSVCPSPGYNRYYNFGWALVVGASISGPLQQPGAHVGPALLNCSGEGHAAPNQTSRYAIMRMMCEGYSAVLKLYNHVGLRACSDVRSADADAVAAEAAAALAAQPEAQEQGAVRHIIPANRREVEVRSPGDRADHSATAGNCSWAATAPICAVCAGSLCQACLPCVGQDPQKNGSCMDCYHTHRAVGGAINHCWLGCPGEDLRLPCVPICQQHQCPGFV